MIVNQKIKTFFKKYKIFVLVGIVLLIIIFMLILTIRDEEKDANGIDIIDGTKPVDLPSEFSLVQQPLGYHKNYEITFVGGVLQQINRLENKYPSFNVKNVDHFDNIENFIRNIDKSNLKLEKIEPSPELAIYYWEDENDTVSYSRDRNTLFVRFSQPVNIPSVSFSPKDEKTLEYDLKKFANEYFSSNFEYIVAETLVEGNFYRISFSRSLKGLPVYLELPQEYMLLTPDGRLKEGMFLLEEFENSSFNYPFVSSENLKDNISRMEYPKSVEFEVLDLKIQDDYAPYGYALFSNPFLQKGSIEISQKDLVYFFGGVNQEVLVPTFLFKGSGLLDVEGELASSRFTVLASAIDSKYVYVHPASHFRSLESFE